MNGNLVDLLFDDVKRRHPRSLQGMIESRDQAPAQFARIAGTFLEWFAAARGAARLPHAADAFARFCSDVNMAQGRYELDGHYENKTFAECLASVYGHDETMTEYLWGVYLSNFLWSHHLDLMLFFEERFLAFLKPEGKIVEIAPGHGGWGLWALHNRPGLTLTGFDVSPASMKIAGALAKGAGLEQRARYEERNAMDLHALPSPQAQACICCFLVEHLEAPRELFKAMAHVTEPGGLVFFTGALTAAQVDHIYEFRLESELIVMAEQAGFRVLESRSVAPARILKNATFLPRSMALVMQKKTHDTW